MRPIFILHGCTVETITAEKLAAEDESKKAALKAAAEKAAVEDEVKKATVQATKKGIYGSGGGGGGGGGRDVENSEGSAAEVPEVVKTKLYLEYEEAVEKRVSD